MNKTVQNLEVVSNTQINRDNFLLVLKSQTPLEGIRAGQFATILVKNSSSTFLRRPFSIHDVDYSSNTIHILIKKVGDGSNQLSFSKVGESLDVMLPLGNQFSMPDQNETVLLIGGGVGVAPLYLLAKELRTYTSNIHILLGARTAEDQILLEKYDEVGTVYTTTEDGSHGEKGFVTNHTLFNEQLNGISRIYTCGPEPMMKAVASKAKQAQVACEVSLENVMACGFGVCLCCVTETKKGNKCVCTEGPVFNYNDLEWQI